MDVLICPPSPGPAEVVVQVKVQWECDAWSPD